MKTWNGNGWKVSNKILDNHFLFVNIMNKSNDFWMSKHFGTFVSFWWRKSTTLVIKLNSPFWSSPSACQNGSLFPLLLWGYSVLLCLSLFVWNLAFSIIVGFLFYFDEFFWRIFFDNFFWQFFLTNFLMIFLTNFSTNFSVDFLTYNLLTRFWVLGGQTIPKNWA